MKCLNSEFSITQFNNDVYDFFEHLDLNPHGLHYGYFHPYIAQKTYIEEKLNGPRYEFEIEINDKKEMYRSILVNSKEYIEKTSAALKSEYYSMLREYGLVEWKDVADEFSAIEQLTQELDDVNDDSIFLLELLSKPYFDYAGFQSINSTLIFRLSSAAETHFQGKQVKLLSAIRKLAIHFKPIIGDDKFNKRVMKWIDDVITFFSMFVQKTKNIPTDVEKTKIILSTSPYEFLTMSFGSGWTSCFRYQGAYATAIPRLMSSHNTLIAYVEDKNSPLNIGAYKTFYKQMRTYVVFSENFDNFFISKTYPIYSQNFVDAISNKIKELFYSDSTDFREYLSQDELGEDNLYDMLAYLDSDDALYLDFNRSSTAFVGKVFVANPSSQFLFSDIPIRCQDCGDDLESDDFGDEDCGGEFRCIHCVERNDEEDYDDEE